MIVVAAIGVAVVVFDASVCPSANLLGVPCPGCGLSRASMALLRGDLQAAYRFHPLVFVALPVLGIAAARIGYTEILGARPRAPSLVLDRWITIGGAILILLLIVVWLARFAGAFGGPVPLLGTIWQRW